MPFAVHPPLGRPRGLNVQGVKAGVADHPNAGLAAFRLHLLPDAHRSVEEAAVTIVWLATHPNGGPTGGFFRDKKRIKW
jgi:hypothetical protein